MSPRLLRWQCPGWSVLLLLLLQSACSAGALRGTWAGGRYGVPSHYAQSCVTLPAGCKPVGATGEILVPTTVGRVVKAAEAVQGLLNLKDFLDFPCTAEMKENPLGKAEKMLRKKLDKYDRLPGENRRALVTPQLGISR